MASKLYDYTPTELQKLLDESNSYADLLRKLNMSEHGGNRITLRKIINEYDLDLSKINKNRKQENIKILQEIQFKEKPLSEILKKDVSYSSSTLIKRLFKEGLKQRKCEICGITKWMGKEITFQLHHKDEDHRNNELTNLQVLCPNCHSQTENYAGKSKSKKPKLTKEQEKKKAQRGISEDGLRFYDGYGNYKILCPVCKENFINKESEMCRKCYDKKRKMPKVSKEELFKILETNSYISAANLLGVDRKTVRSWYDYYIHKERKNEIMKINSDKAPSREKLKNDIRKTPFTKIGEKYGVTDNAVRKWCDVYKLPRKTSDIKKISDEDWIKI